MRVRTCRASYSRARSSFNRRWSGRRRGGPAPGPPRAPTTRWPAEPAGPGGPGAIGAAPGGPPAAEPGLGPIDDFARFVRLANRLGMQVALDIAFQASPDHPWVREHPGWFRHRP